MGCPCDAHTLFYSFLRFYGYRVKIVHSQTGDGISFALIIFFLFANIELNIGTLSTDLQKPKNYYFMQWPRLTLTEAIFSKWETKQKHKKITSR